MNLSTIRQKIPALSNATYLNTGTFGPSPTPVIDEIRDALDLIETYGPFSPVVRQRIEKDGYEAVRSLAAGLLNAEPDEIILTRSASDGINTIAHGLDWFPGDEIVISSEEHQSGTLPWLVLSQRAGVKVRTAAVHPDPSTTLQNFADQITGRTRLVFFSHVSCLSGIRLAARDICRLAHDNGALAVIDGAHALGQFPVNVRGIGCDAYIGCGHKWLLGPQGTSLAFIAREHQQTIKPSWIGWGAQVEFSLNLAEQTYTLHNSARKYEFGTKQWPLFMGLGKTIQFINEIGINNIQDRVQPLALDLKQTLENLPEFKLLTPMAAERSTGIVSIRLNEKTPENINEDLWKRHRLLAAYWHPVRRLRLSIAFFTTNEEVDQALEAICDVTSQTQ